MSLSIFTRSHFQRAITDIRDNRFISGVTMVTITLSVLILSTFALFVVNVGDVIHSWKNGLRIMAYAPETPPGERIAQIENIIAGMPHVASVSFIPKSYAFETLKEQMTHQSGLFEHLSENPLPDAFEIRMTPTSDSWEKIAGLAESVSVLEEISDVEYGREWIGKFSAVFNLIQLAGISMGVIFLMVMSFIVSNTIRLAMFARREDVEIMRLVGATDQFIKAPFYIQGMIQGAVGGVLGLIFLFLIYLTICANMGRALPGTTLFEIRFLPPFLCLGMVFCSTLVGWLGCLISIKQFLKN